MGDWAKGGTRKWTEVKEQTFTKRALFTVLDMGHTDTAHRENSKTQTLYPLIVWRWMRGNQPLLFYTLALFSLTYYSLVIFFCRCCGNH